MAASSDTDPEPPRPPARWEDVELTEAQVKWGLEHTKKAVRQSMFMRHYNWQTRNPYRRPRPTATELFRHYLGRARRHGTEAGPAAPQYASLRDEYQAQIRQVLWNCCLFFAGDERWLALNPRYTFGKGLLFRGGLGVGKTTLLHLFCENPVRGYQVVTTAELNRTFLQAGPNHELHKSLEKPAAWGIDELGQEAQVVQYMGNWVPVLEETLSIRARLAERYPERCPLVHATTNLPVLRPDEFRDTEQAGPTESNSLELHYGNRVVDRFRKLFNLVEMPAIPSFR